MASMVLPALITGGASIVGSIFNWLKGKNDTDAQREYMNIVATLHNEWLANRSQEVKGILDELTSRGQDIFGPQVTTSAMEGTRTFRETETPFITPEYSPLAGLQRAMVERRLTSPTGLPAGFAETGVRAINESAAGGEANLRNFARRRGLDFEGLQIGDPGERARRGQIASFRAGLPLQARALQTEDLGLAQNILTAFGRGTRRRGRERTTQLGTVTGPPDYSAIAGMLLTPGPQAAQIPG